MRALNLLLLAAGVALAGLAGAAPVTLIDTEFGTAAKPINEVSPDGKKSLTGAVPEGWVENSGWQKDIVISYTVGQEDNHSYLRVTKTSGGTQQLAFYLKEIPEETFFRVELTARSASSAAVSVGLRDAGPPYSFHWSVAPGLLGQWQDFVYEFRVAPVKHQVGLWINMNQDASYDLSRLKLVAKSRADIIAELQARYPAAAIKNLAANSRFPLGLPTGWALDRDNSDGDEVQVAPDPAQPGPSGCPALRVSGAKKWALWSAPFALPRSFEPHNVSLYLKGPAKARLVVLGDGRETGWKNISLDNDQWQRVAVTFTPQLLARGHQLRLECTGGTLWLDAFQAEPGTEPSAYTSQEPCEVALALADTSASAARVVFTDETVQVRYAVTGEATGARLHCYLVNLYGQTVKLPPVALKPGFLQTGTLAIPIPKDRPLGAFRLEALVQDAQSKDLSPGSEVVFYRLPRPKYWNKPAPRSAFGIHTNSTTRHILMAKAIGANWTRLHDAGTQYIGWAHLEPEPGQWMFYDAELQRFGRYGLKILGLLSTSPLWANYQGTPRNGYFDRYVEPKDLSQFANYVKVVTTRYKGLIDAYDVWNEPWGTSFWSMGWDADKKEFKRSPTASEDYYKLQKATYDAALAVDPKLTILGFNTYGGYNGTEWTADLLKFGALDACTDVCYHHYSSPVNGYPDDDVSKAYVLAWDAILKQQKRVPKSVWMTEGSPTTYQIANGFYNYTELGMPPDDYWAIGDRLSRYMVSLLAQGVDKFFLYTMHGHGPFTGGVAPWTTLVGYDGYLHPCAAAHAALTWQLEDAKFVKVTAVKPGVYAYLFQADKRAVAVLSTKPGHAAYTLPQIAQAQLRDLFGNPVAPGTKLGEYVVFVSTPGQAGTLAKALQR